MPEQHLGRTYVVTGAASGIGAATVAYLRSAGARVIASDLRDADVQADLATSSGRATFVEEVARLAGAGLDAVVANAGGGPAEIMLALNFFGATATLEGLRPLLGGSKAPRAVVVSSISALGPFDETLVRACLDGDEPAANAAATKALGAGTNALVLYGSAKRALNLWARKAACEARWAEAGIPLNVVAPGIVDTRAAAWILSDADRRAEARRRTPLAGAFPGRPEAMAALLAWCVSSENALMTGQVFFADAGFEAKARGEAVW